MKQKKHILRIAVKTAAKAEPEDRPAPGKAAPVPPPAEDCRCAPEQETSCCAPEKQHRANCALCGKPLVYFDREKPLECAVCHQVKPADCACEDGHFVCDACHSGGGAVVRKLLLESTEQDPAVLLNKVFRLPEVHLHGPEHHSIVPCVLLTAYRNCGGKLDLAVSLREAWRRGQKLAGGACGYLGVCGAAAGAGIFASIVSGATPLTPEAWAVPQRLTAACLETMTAVGGPRCCKRTSRMALETAAAFSEKEFGVKIPVSRPSCAHWPWNRECIRERCPYWPGRKEERA